MFMNVIKYTRLVSNKIHNYQIVYNTLNPSMLHYRVLALASVNKKILNPPVLKKKLQTYWF